MERRKNSNLHVVREPEDPTDKIIDEIMDELNSEDGMPEKEVREEQRLLFFATFIVLIS